MVFDLVHKHIVVLIVPEVNDNRIAIVYDFSHSFNVVDAVVLLKGFYSAG